MNSAERGKRVFWRLDMSRSGAPPLGAALQNGYTFGDLHDLPPAIAAEEMGLRFEEK
jgi:hypothetical protein